MRFIHTFFSRAHDTKGFSLAELIIYLGILGISAGIFGGVLNSISTTQISEFNQNEVSGQLNFAIQTIQRLIRTSSVIEGESGVASSTLVLQMPNEAQSPTTIYVQNNRLYFTQGTGGIAQAITNERVLVDSLEFRKFARTGAKDVVQIDLAISQTQPTGERVARSLRSAVTRVDAAAFDGDLLPNADNSYNIGSIDTRWKDGWFSGQVHAGEFCIGTSDCISSWAGAGVTGSGSANYVTKWSSASAIAASTLLYDNGTSVGISTINPSASYKLDVNGSANATGLCIAGDCKTAWSQVGGGTSQWTTTSTSIYYNTGNVGIGTASPGHKLHVQDTVSSSARAHIQGGTTAGYSALTVANTAATSYAGIFALGSAAAGSVFGTPQAGTLQITSNGGKMIVGTADAQPLILGTNNVNRITLDSSGNVGIGTTTPAQKLSVVGTIESTSGGFKFPDGTTQTTAASGGGATTQRATLTSNTLVSLTTLECEGSSYYKDVPGTSITLTANKKYRIEAFADIYTYSATYASIRLTFPSGYIYGPYTGISYASSQIYPSVGMTPRTSATNWSQSLVYQDSNGDHGTSIPVPLVLEVGASGGDIRLQVRSCYYDGENFYGGNITVYAGSSILVTEIQ